jgi:hypothetical protein
LRTNHSGRRQETRPVALADWKPEERSRELTAWNQTVLIGRPILAETPPTRRATSLAYYIDALFFPKPSARMTKTVP